MLYDIEEIYFGYMWRLEIDTCIERIAEIYTNRVSTPCPEASKSIP